MDYTHQQGSAAWAFSALLFLITAALGWFYYDTDQQKNSLNLELTQAKSDLKIVERRLDKADSNFEVTDSELSSVRSRWKDAKAELDLLKKSETALNLQNQSLENGGTTLSEKVDTLTAQLEQLVAQNQSLEADKKTAEQQLSTTKNNLLEVQGELTEASTTAELYQSAREQLALKQAENETYSETIKRIKADMSEEANAMAALENSLQSQLSQLNQEKEKLVTQLEDGTTAIKLPESILFASGSAKLTEDGLKALKVLSAALTSFPNHLISIQGHTDSRKIASSVSEKYPTNWELSTARAASAVRELIATGVPAQKIQAVGFADTRPLVTEVGAQSRQQNRRIEVILFPNKLKTKLLE